MGNLKKLDIELIGIGNALLNKKLCVPRYQRSYAWKTKQIEDLYFDLSNAIDNDIGEYFLGSIVTSKNDLERPEVVDGQQRLATIAILLSAIRDYFYNHEDNDRANGIESKYLLEKDLHTLELIPKLKLNDMDHNYFLSYILTPPNSENRSIETSNESHKRIQNAGKILREKIKKMAELHSPKDYLLKWVDFIHNNLKVIWVSVVDDANAFTIFETLNDRGLALAITDLLKNYLFGLSSDRISEVQNNWISMFSKISAISNEDMVITYIRHFWSSKYGLTREKDLYAAIKNKINSKMSAITFSEELHKGSNIYSAILNHEHEIWNQYDQSTLNHLSTINLLGIIQIRPLILSILSNFNKKETKRAFKLMVSWSVRFLIHGGLGGGVLERYYCDNSKEIRKGNIKTSKDLLNRFDKIVPNDSTFKSSFVNATVSKSKIARYYLRVIERQARGEDSIELTPNENVEFLNLEHIMPEKYLPNWPYINEDDHRAYVKRIGNLTLLKTKINSEQKSARFEDKLEVYKKSELEITSSLKKYDNWDIYKIKERQKWLADLALKAWPNKII